MVLSQKHSSRLTDCYGHRIFDKDEKKKVCIKEKRDSSCGARETGYLHVQGGNQIPIPHPAKKSIQNEAKARNCCGKTILYTATDKDLLKVTSVAQKVIAVLNTHGYMKS